MVDVPRYCRPAAYELFAAQLATLEETSSLVRAAVAVSMHELESVSPDANDQILDGLAEQVRARVQSVTPSALVARLHEVLFDEHGFAGNTDDYYAAENSYLPKVLETRRGLPVTLALVYKAVAQKLGVAVRGINSPAHFMAAVESDGHWMLIDPFDGGRMLSRDEVFDRLENYAGAPLVRDDSLLRTATHIEWLSRIIRNLEVTFTQTNRAHDRLAMGELQTLLADVA